MATPRDVLRSSTEKNNFTRLNRLLIDGGTYILRELFDNKIPPQNLNCFLMNSTMYKRLQSMKKKKIINSKQWNKLYPTPTTCGKSTDFDITLLFKFLREFCVLTPPSKGWDDLPDDKDPTLPADLARIKYYRNEVYAHPRKTDLDVTEFEDLWKRIKDALLRIVNHYDPSAVSVWEEAIEKLLRDPLDTKKSHEYDKKVKVWCAEDPDGQQETLPAFSEENKESKDQVAPKESSVVNVHCEWRSRMQGLLAGSAGTIIIILYKDDPASLINLLNEALPFGLLIKSIVAGSIVLQLTSTTDEALNDLLTRYQSGQLKKDLEKIFITEEIKKLIGDKNVDLSVEIREEEIENARHTLLTAEEEAKEEEQGEKLTEEFGSKMSIESKAPGLKFEIFEGDIVEDGENKWQAHLAVITSKDQAEQVLAELKKNDPDVAEATHNIWAYRIFNGERHAYDEHCEDDGDDNSGARVLRFLRRARATDVMVVVSCWYETAAEEFGDIRFKCIKKSILDLLLTYRIVEIPQSMIKKFYEEMKYTPIERAKELQTPKFDLLHGEAIEDRKSTFQAHLADITSREQVDRVLDELKKDRKIAKATYNMWACRVYDEKTKAYIEEGYDDGENQGGERLLHLLQRSDAKNVVIIVTRWHGGIHLGNDRFKHINKCASELLQQRSKRIEETATASTEPKKATKKRTRKSTKKP